MAKKLLKGTRTYRASGTARKAPPGQIASLRKKRIGKRIRIKL